MEITNVSDFFCKFCVRNESKHEAREVQWDCGLSLHGKEFAAWAWNIFVSTMLRKLDLGVSKHVKQSAEDNDPVSRFSSPKAFQNPK